MLPAKLILIQIMYQYNNPKAMKLNYFSENKTILFTFYMCIYFTLQRVLTLVRHHQDTNTAAVLDTFQMYVSDMLQWTHLVELISKFHLAGLV
jgi:hypothetical protein